MKLFHRILNAWAACLLFASLTAAAEPPRETQNDDSNCRSEERLFGDWSSYRPGSSGPTWHRVRFTCDCRYVALRQGQESPARVRGTFVVDRGRLQMLSPPRTEPEPSKPFHFERGELYWAGDGASTPHRYRRTAALQCAPKDR